MSRSRRARLAASLHARLLAAYRQWGDEDTHPGIERLQAAELLALAEAYAQGRTSCECLSCQHGRPPKDGDPVWLGDRPFDLEHYDPDFLDLLDRLGALLRLLLADTTVIDRDWLAALAIRLVQPPVVVPRPVTAAPPPAPEARRAVASLAIAPTAPPVPVLSAA